MIFEQVAADRKVRVFSLSTDFLDQYKDKQPEWGPVGYFTYKRCVTVDTPVLCDDLVWRPAGELQVGQGIIGFDPERKGRALRHLRHGIVMHNETEDAEVLGVELEDGTVLYATPDHPWLVKLSETDNRLYWKETQELGGTHKGGAVHLLRPFGPVWDTDTSFSGGYLSAAYDGEGCFDRMNSVQFIQVDNPMLRKVESLLDEWGIPYTKGMRKKVEGRQQVYNLRTHRRRTLFRLLGIFQPQRLLEVFKRNLQAKGGGAFRCDPDDIVRVVRVFPAGKKEIAVLSTDIQTHFTGGFASHNTYARQVEGEDRTEEFWETCRRVVEGCYNIQKIHCRQMGLPWNEQKAQKSAQDMFERMWAFKFLPPGRGLWMMGTDVVYERGAASLQNCAFVSSEGISEDFADPFCFLMDMSMLGVGTGADTKGAGKVKLQMPRTTEEPYVVEDSREGWVELIRVILNTFVGKGHYPLNIDYTQIRGRGVPLKTFGGTASGPKPLQDMVENLTRLLLPKGVKVKFNVPYHQDTGKIDVTKVKFSGSGEPYRITSAIIVDIFNYIGKGVVAGGIRRTAEIMFGEPDDDEFINLKSDQKALEDRRWASNNSVYAYQGMDYSTVAARIADNGEPGVLWLENARAFSRMDGVPDNKDWRVMGSNPCGEQLLESHELCNLVETFPAHHDDYDDYERTLKMAYLYAKTVTLVPTHVPRANAVMTRNRRIGCSMSGIIQAMVKLGRRGFLQWCDKGYDYIHRLDRIYSDWLGVPLSIKTTTVKPSGTTSLLCGATPGIHYPHAPFYVRHIRVANTSPLVEAARKAGYTVEPDDYADDTSVVAFPVAEKHFVKGKCEATIWEQFVNAADMQRHWANNAVSVTVTFNKEEVRDIQSCLESFEDRLKGVSMLPLEDADHGYKHPPYQAISEDEYKEMAARISPIDMTGSQHEVDDKFCSGDKCELRRP